MIGFQFPVIRVPHVCLSVLVPLIALQDHVKVECVKRLVNCPNLAQGCVETVPLDEVDEHLAKSCRKRVVECRLDCGLRFACDRRSEHEVRAVVIFVLCKQACAQFCAKSFQRQSQSLVNEIWVTPNICIACMYPQNLSET